MATDPQCAIDQALTRLAAVYDRIDSAVTPIPLRRELGADVAAIGELLADIDLGNSI